MTGKSRPSESTETANPDDAPAKKHEPIVPPPGADGEHITLDRADQPTRTAWAVGVPRLGTRLTAFGSCEVALFMAETLRNGGHAVSVMAVEYPVDRHAPAGGAQ